MGQLVVEQTALRSHQISTPSGPLRRNRRHLIHCPNTEPQNTEAREEDTTPTEVNAYIHPLPRELFEQGVAEFRYRQIVWIQLGSNNKNWTERGDVVVV